jgi:hypothetical protein
MAEAEAGTQIPGEVSPETAAQARRMGWVPQDEFKGDDKRWIEADKFLERGQNELPIMRERLRKMDGTIVSLNTKISGMNDTFGEFQKHQKGVAERAYERGIAEITKKQRKATADGDVAAFDAAEVEKQNLKLEVPEVVAPAEPAADDPRAAEAEIEFNTWKKDNTWFDKYKPLGNYAAAISVEIEQEEGLTGTELYERVTEEVKTRFPEKFENPARQQPNAVVGDTGSPVPQGKQTFGNLPQEAQDQCLKFIKDIPGFTKEQYVKDYEW